MEEVKFKHRMTGNDEGFDDFLGEIQEVGNRPWEIASFEKKLRVIFLMIMIIIGPG